MKTCIKPLRALFAMAALALALPAAAQRDRYYGERYDDERYDEARYDDEEYGDERYDDGRYDDGRYERRYEERRHEQARVRAREFDYARVIDADPIIDVESRPVKREECRQEPVARRQAVRPDAPAISQGIIASVLAQPSATAGAQRAAASTGTRTAYTRRCTYRTEYVEQERITGYDVTYRYRGRIYYAVTDRDPGDRIRVAVN